LTPNICAVSFTISGPKFLSVLQELLARRHGKRRAPAANVNMPDRIPIGATSRHRKLRLEVVEV
jgi:hypothetical protein